MRHSDAEDMLARRAELTRTEEAALDEHLSGCAACRETAEIYGRQTAFMRSLPMVQPPHALRAGVMAGLEGSTRRRWPLWPSFRPSFRPSLVIAPLGVCAASVLAAVIYQHQLSSPSSNTAAAPYTRAHATTQAPTADKQAIPTKRHTSSAGRHRTVKHTPANSSATQSTSTQGSDNAALGPIGPAPSQPTPEVDNPSAVAAPTQIPSPGRALLSAGPRPTEPPSGSRSSGGTSGNKNPKPPPARPTVAPPPAAGSVPTVVISQPAPVPAKTATPVPTPGQPPIISVGQITATPTP